MLKLYKLQIKHIQQHSKHWITQTHTTGYGRCIRNELTTKQLGKFKLVYPRAPPLKLSSCCGPPTLGACPLAQSWVCFLMPTPFLWDFPLQLDDVMARSDGSTWVVRGDVLPPHTVELTNCGGVPIPSEAAVVVMQKISTGCWVGMTNGMWFGWEIGGLATRLLTLIRCLGIYSGVLIWWEMCCLTCIWEKWRKGHCCCLDACTRL